MRNVILASLVLALLLGTTAQLIDAERRAPLPASPRLAPADLVLVNGVVHTLDPDLPRASSLAIQAGILVGVSAGEPDPSWIGGHTRVIDLRGACVVPGLWDAHAHLLSLGLSRTRLDLRETTSHSWPNIASFR